VRAFQDDELFSEAGFTWECRLARLCFIGSAFWALSLPFRVVTDAPVISLDRLTKKPSRAQNDEKGPRDLIVDKNAWPGASGSPIFLENGAVIGILVRRGIDNGSGLAMDRPASFIEKVLAQRGKE
jgi:hypothetical protein